MQTEIESQEASAMKVSKEKMAEHREKIITSASKRFRELGFEGISVADLMKEAGLTHGGFYGHFDSKEELVALASERAMNDSAEKWEKVITEASSNPLEALAKHYLSLRHCERPGSGCLFAALGGDISRQAASVKAAVTAGLQQFIGLLTRIVPGKTKEVRRRKAIAAYASMIGGMVLARSISDPALSQEILDAVAESLHHADVDSQSAQRVSHRTARHQPTADR
jgi:TetR/AcrR family transcriptional repressor of nem operon